MGGHKYVTLHEDTITINLVILTISFIQIKVVRELFQKPGFKFVVSIK